MRSEIAKIKSTFLGIEDHGILTAVLHVDYGGAGQGIGNHGLDQPAWRLHSGAIVIGDRPSEHFRPESVGRCGTAYGMEFVRRIIKACGVRSWEEVTGRTILVLFDEDDPGHLSPRGIENMPTELGSRFIFSDLRLEIDEMGLV